MIQGRPIISVIPPNLGFQKEQDSDSRHRKKNIKLLEDRGRAIWQKETDYDRRALAENTIYRYKTIIGNKLRSRSTATQNTEIQIGVKMDFGFNQISIFVNFTKPIPPFSPVRRGRIVSRIQP